MSKMVEDLKVTSTAQLAVKLHEHEKAVFEGTAQGKDYIGFMYHRQEVQRRLWSGLDVNLDEAVKQLSKIHSLGTKTEY